MKTELKKLSQLTAALITAVVLAACGSTGTTEEGGATSDTGAMTSGAGLDERGVSSESMGEGMGEAEAPLETVFYFDFDQSSLRPETRAALDAQAAHLANTTGMIRLEGHADERGSREYNLALGERRAKAVANYLSIQGIDMSRIETISYGEEKPVAFGKDEASYQLNRRVELKEY